MVDVERVRRAVVRLDSSQQGRYAREEVEAGMPLREVLSSYDLSLQQVEDLGAIHQWLRENDELPDSF